MINKTFMILKFFLFENINISPSSEQQIKGNPNLPLKEIV